MKESQNGIELRGMLRYIQDHSIKSILEVGSRYGTTLYDMAHATPVGSTIVSVELAGGPWGRPDSLPKLIEVIDKLCEEEYDAHLILGDSKSSEVYDQVAKLAPFDFVFIDGDHTYAGALNDWNKYGPMGKHVGFHDINTALEVAKLWDNLKDKCFHSRVTEFISYTGPQMGIGVMQRGEAEL